MDLRAGKTVGELLWNGRDPARWNDHLAVRHRPPCKISERHPFGQRWVQGDACEEWFKHAAS